MRRAESVCLPSTRPPSTPGSSRQPSSSSWTPLRPSLTLTGNGVQDPKVWLYLGLVDTNQSLGYFVCVFAHWGISSSNNCLLDNEWREDEKHYLHLSPNQRYTLNSGTFRSKSKKILSLLQTNELCGGVSHWMCLYRPQHIEAPGTQGKLKQARRGTATHPPQPTGYEEAAPDREQMHSPADSHLHSRKISRWRPPQSRGYSGQWACAFLAR